VWGHRTRDPPAETIVVPVSKKIPTSGMWHQDHREGEARPKESRLYSA
jgi:hypothetical protein